MSYKVEATVDGIRFLYDDGEVEVDYNASNGDVVRLTIEPLEVKVTDGFRAAVKKACNCDSSSGGGSGGSGGGVLVVHETVTEEDGQEVRTLDATYAEIASAVSVCIDRIGETPPGLHEIFYMDMYGYVEGIGYTVHFSADEMPYICDSTSDYPVRTAEK